MTAPEVDLTGPNGRIIAAALALASERPWREVALRDVAERAGITLAAMREHFASKSEIIAGLMRAVDDAVLTAAPAAASGEPKRDQLFEVIMARFDVLQPYRTALRSISAEASADPALMRAMLSSQAWMLQAAGIDAGGIEGGMRVAGLAAIYASVYRTWLEDDDPGLARTMAALDRRLRRGERTLSTLDEMGRTARGLVEGLASMFGQKTSKPAHSSTTGSSATSATGSEPTHV